MRTILHLVAVILLGLGAPVTALGLLALVYSGLAPAQPPPSLNEGPGLAGFFGLLFIASGLLSVTIGIVMLSVLRATRPPHELVSADWTRQHRRLW